MPSLEERNRHIAIMSAVLALAVIVSTVSAESPFKPLPAAEVNQSQKDKARKIAVHLLTAWRERRFEPLSTDYSSRMKEVMTSAAQEKAYYSLKALFGDFKSLQYAETVIAPNLPEFIIYRFRGTFSDAKEKPEVRVVFDKKGKVAGFWVKHWKDEVL
jgi:molybdopterin-guanine dinucleotide biosynthesis protein A